MHLFECISHGDSKYSNEILKNYFFLQFLDLFSAHFPPTCRTVRVIVQHNRFNDVIAEVTLGTILASWLANLVLVFTRRTPLGFNAALNAEMTWNLNLDTKMYMRKHICHDLASTLFSHQIYFFHHQKFEYRYLTYSFNNWQSFLNSLMHRNNLFV